MKNDVSKLFVLAAVVAVMIFAAPADAQRRASAQVGANCVGGFQALFDEIEAVPLSAAEIEEITYLREEEKLARDVYLTLAERWQLPIFSNIAAAEQKHMDLVYKVIEIYEIEDSITDDTVGAFNNLELQSLYGELVADGEESLIAALTVGATIEDMDLADLYDLIDVTDNPDVALIAHNLAAGSRNHLRAFVTALGRNGGSYEAQYLDPDVMASILASDPERGVVYDELGDVLAECGGPRHRRAGTRGAAPRPAAWN